MRVDDFDVTEQNQILAALMVRETALSLILESELGEQRDIVRMAREQTSRAKAKVVLALVGGVDLDAGQFYAGMPPRIQIYEGMD